MQKDFVVRDGRKFHLSALTLGDLRRFESALLGIEQKAASGFGSMLALVPVIHASISKLHPEIALEQLEEMLDLGSFAELLDGVLEVSGLKRSLAPTASGGSSGESQPAAE